MNGLTWDQQAGRACIICNRPLDDGAIHRGTLTGHHGAHRLDTEAWACPTPNPT